MLGSAITNHIWQLFHHLQFICGRKFGDWRTQITNRLSLATPEVVHT
jgi:hypothetical protein